MLNLIGLRNGLIIFIFLRSYKRMYLSKFNFFKQFKNKKVLITGHNGFKGSWLTIWLSLLGARVVGISLPNTNWTKIKDFP